MKPVNFLTVTLLILVSLAAAQLAAGLVSHRLAHTAPRTGETRTTSTTAAAADDLASFSPIVEKGLFGRATRGKLLPIAAATPPRGDASPPLTDLVLVGTAQGSFRETFALIRRTNPPEERVFRLGDRVFDGGRLVSVRKERVEILSGGKRITLATPVGGTTETAPAPARLQAGGSTVIDQRQLEAALANIGQVMTDARLLPSLKGGSVEGFRVSEVKPAGAFAMLGIRNGDILVRLNDLPVDSPERAIQSLASLKGQNRIKLDLIRDGQPATFTYDIR